MAAEDEPFEFFKGFAEIFVTIGLSILLTGVFGVLTLFAGATALILLPLSVAGVAWWWAGYFTLKRRMTLPSMLLAATFGAGVYFSVMSIMWQYGPVIPGRSTFVLPPLVSALAMGLWYHRFRLPFSAFILGLFALATLYTLTLSLENIANFAIAGRSSAWSAFFDLNESPVFAFATLAFGLVAFLAGMWFDMKDPHRLGRHSATAFWLHLLAAPALVNTVALTLYNSGGATAMPLLILALAVITLLALVIDRRSFLSAAIAYIAIVITWMTGEGFGSWVGTMLILGGLITAIGTWWVQLRGFVMARLPDFPGKDRLPPYSRPE
ncbi:hypothetical protein H0485_02015 [Pseudogemmobacter sp. CC-YST710]|uniref:DUF2157 domain-containing protein n=2 Tax=Pseudogemmobacter faecipullorum TaxID=2755041 RepID=A0ABS8CHC1_9RHOB|nr:hypothetical protein [Pseudogemmobacter faecipullorum]